jgi:hypothetical protein
MTADQPIDTAAPEAKPLTRALVFLLLAVLVIGGATVWWMSRRTGPATEQSKAFLQDLIAGNLDSARARCTSSIDFDAMERLAHKETGKMRFWGKLLDESYVETTRGERADVDGSLTFEKLSKTFQATLQKQPDGTYLITSYGLN